MLKEEFERRIDREIPDELYKKIEYVYNYHPSQMDKDDAAELYIRFGPRVFWDMKDAADEIFNLEDQIRDLEKKKHNLDLEIASIKKEIELAHREWRDSKNDKV